MSVLLHWVDGKLLHKDGFLFFVVFFPRNDEMQTLAAGFFFGDSAGASVLAFLGDSVAGAGASPASALFSTAPSLCS